MKNSTFEKKVEKFEKNEFRSFSLPEKNTVTRNNKVEEKYQIVYSSSTNTQDVVKLDYSINSSKDFYRKVNQSLRSN